MSDLRPFLSYYGGKWRAAPRYPAPEHDRIVEPFAGSAGYATRYHTRQILLVEKNPRVAAIWRYLIGADPDRILALPDVPEEGISALEGLDAAERWLMGFWVNSASASPKKRSSAWMRGGTTSGNFWGPALRERLAWQISQIRHWEVIEGDYSAAPDIEATWFVDPPYQEKGKIYPNGSKDIDFEALAHWCKSRRGTVIACENEGADWLPFSNPFSIKSARGKSSEVAWVQRDESGTRQIGLLGDE